MGSSLGWYNILQKKGYKVHLIVPNSYPAFLQWMKNDEAVLRHEEERELSEKLIAEADIIFHLDYNSIGRSGAMQDCLHKARALKVIVDHHQQPEDFADLLFSDTGMSSTCEMIFHLIANLGWEEDIDEDIANCLYTGLITDTGNFRYSGTTPTTHRVAATLLEKGVQSNRIASEVYDNNAPNRYKLLSRTLENMQVLDNLKTSILYLTQKDLEQFNYAQGDTEGFVNYGLAIKGIIIAVFFIEKDGKVKISFRSKGSFDVNKLAREHFSGGGHTNAAGGVSYDGLAESIERLKRILPHYQTDLESIQL